MLVAYRILGPLVEEMIIRQLLLCRFLSRCGHKVTYCIQEDSCCLAFVHNEISNSIYNVVVGVSIFFAFRLKSCPCVFGMVIDRRFVDTGEMELL